MSLNAIMNMQSILHYLGTCACELSIGARNNGSNARSSTWRIWLQLGEAIVVQHKSKLKVVLMSKILYFVFILNDTN